MERACRHGGEGPQQLARVLDSRDSKQAASPGTTRDICDGSRVRLSGERKKYGQELQRLTKQSHVQPTIGSESGQDGGENSVTTASSTWEPVSIREMPPQAPAVGQDATPRTREAAWVEA